MAWLIALAAVTAAAVVAVEVARWRGALRLGRQRLHDRLTGLVGSGGFEVAIGRALARARRYQLRTSVLFLNLDRFEVVNSTLGRARGDEVLAAVANRLLCCLREEDVAARVGGDEFGVLLENVADETAPARVAERILSCLQEPITVDGQRAVVSVSLGIAGCTDGDGDASELIQEARLAMQQAKAKGRAGFDTFDPETGAIARSRLRLESDLATAVGAGELVIHYQPLVSLATSGRVGVEALVRWRHPELGLLLPGTFLAAAERSGAVAEIDRWVLEQSCREVAFLRPFASGGGDGAPLGLSVNVSANQLRRGRALVDDVARALEESGLPPGMLTLEIVESVLIDDPATATDTLRMVRDLGVRVAIDDFGTGYSSLAYLRDLPFTDLKIDGSFVQGADHGVNAAIIRSVVALAADLGLRVTAEGVETESQARSATALGCHTGQGHWFGPPMSPGDLVRTGPQARRRSVRT
ncbi:MAG TPA: bifunctional diguanylate cyclase/phosphodiesterase [Acidimicrobiales bacterium]|nr:bifunctional diguanylate cyclase/phosphodiesterase [Acidimicrobiales bacterium]